MQKLLLIFLFFTVNIFAASPDTANKIFVSPYGHDLNDGTANHPYRTIQQAVNAATPGTSVVLNPGVYQESVVISRSGTPNSPIHLISSERWKAIIQLT